MEAIGYFGQSVEFFGDERIAYVSGSGICIHHLQNGTVEMIWRSETGICTFKYHATTNKLALCHDVAGACIEITQLPDHSRLFAELENPTSDRISDFSFSHEGDRLVGISNFFDHKCVVWSLISKEVLLTVGLETLFEACIVNPIDSNLISFVSCDGVHIGEIREVYGDFSIHVRKTKAESLCNAIPERLDAHNIDSDSQQIQFFCWAPEQCAFVGLSSGEILYLDMKLDKSLFYFLAGKNEDVSNEISRRYPTTAELSTDHLIVGDSGGTISWYSTVQLDGFKDNDDTSLRKISISPKQVYNLVHEFPICMAIDPSYNSLIIGCKGGNIYNVAIILSSTEQNVDSSVGEDELGLSTFKDEPHCKPIQIDDTKPSFSMEPNAILCSTSFDIRVSHWFNGKIKMTSNYLSIILTGAHTGEISFWKSSTFRERNEGNDFNKSKKFEVDFIPRVIPESLTLLDRKFLTSNIGDMAAASVSIMEVVKDPKKQGQSILILGNIYGLINIWMIEAFEYEDEDENDQIINEEFSMIRLKISSVYNEFFYNSAITSVSYNNSFDYLAISSQHDCKIFILQDIVNMNVRVLGFIDARNVSTLNNLTSNVALCIWIENSLMIFYAGGTVMMMESITSSLSSKYLNSVCTWNDSIHQSLLPSLHGFNISTVSNSFPAGVLIYCDDNTKKLVKIYVPSKKFDVDNMSSNISNSSSYYDDVMISSAISPCSEICVTGGMYGFVYIWKISDLSLMSMIRLHSGLVLSITISSNTSSLYSSSTDGSKCIISLENIFGIESVQDISRREVSSGNEVTNDVGDRKDEANDSHKVESSSLWTQRYNQSVIEGIKDFSTSKIADCKAALNVISGRLNTLLKNNLNCDEIEKLDRIDFVIDTVAKENLMKCNDQISSDLILSYANINNYNECVAARIRSLCWDTVEIHSCSLYPIKEGILSESVTTQPKVQSFPVHLYSDAQVQTLERIKRLRSIEIRSQHALFKESHQHLADGVTSSSWMKISGQNCSWINGDGILWPTFDVMRKLNRACIEKPMENVNASDDFKPIQGRIETEDIVDGLEQQLAKSNIDESSCLHLIYPPLTVRTEIQRQFQVTLIQDVLHSIKLEFNKYFDKLHSEKEDSMALMNSKNARIREILEELREIDVVHDAQWVHLEITASAVVVRDEDIDSRPYESAVDRANRLAEEEERRRKEADMADGDIKGRALDEMMHGTLEVKRDVFAEASAMQRPQWMIDMDPSEMTEAQLKEYEEYEDKLKILQFEQMKYRKSLEFEMKRLKQEILETATTFNTNLAKMSDQKLFVLRIILTQELNLARLSLHLITQDFISSSLTLRRERFELTSSKARDIKERLSKIFNRTEILRSQVLMLQEEGKSMDKGFRRDLQVLCDQNFDQDTLRIFTDLYKGRTYHYEVTDEAGGDEYADDKSENTTCNDNISRLMSKKHTKKGAKDASKKQSKMKESGKMKASKGGMAVSSDVDALMGPLQQAAAQVNVVTLHHNLLQDPFYRRRVLTEREKRVVESQIPLLTPQSIEIDCPDGFNVDQYAWSKLQELRSLRIQKEIDEKLMILRLSDVKQRIEEMQAIEKGFDNCLDDLKDSMDTLKFNRKRMANNVELIVSLKQGQDEIDRDSFVTDYKSSALLPSGVVGKYNTLIQQLGHEKIGVLFKIKSFRRKINIIDWEAKHMQLDAWHLDEYFTDLQLLRVTRDFQRVIRAGVDPASRNRAEKLSQRKDYIAADTDSKLNGILNLIERLSMDIEMKDLENTSLLKSILEIRREVEWRNSVKESRDSAKGEAVNSSNLAMKRMQKVVARCHVVDATKMRVEELDILRQELDKIRQRTFPSFVKAARQRAYTNPDEKLN